MLSPLGLLNSQIVLAQSGDCANVLHSLKVSCTSLRLVCSFWILKMRNTVLRLCQFPDCAEHIYNTGGQSLAFCRVH